MLNDILLELLLIVAIYALYDSWRKSAALKTREILADKVDAYLASDAPEVMKDFVFKVFFISAKGWLIHRLIFSMLFSTSQQANENRVSQAEELEVTSEQKAVFKQLIEMGIIVIIKRSPITCLLVFLGLFITVFVKVLIDKLTFSDSISHLQHDVAKAFNKAY